MDFKRLSYTLWKFNASDLCQTIFFSKENRMEEHVRQEFLFSKAMLYDKTHGSCADRVDRDQTAQTVHSDFRSTLSDKEIRVPVKYL